MEGNASIDYNKKMDYGLSIPTATTILIVILLILKIM